MSKDSERKARHYHSKKLEAVHVEFEKLHHSRQRSDVFESMATLIGVSEDVIKRELRLVRIIERARARSMKHSLRRSRKVTR